MNNPSLDVLHSIITEIGDMLGVNSIDGQEYINAVKSLMDGKEMPNYQIIKRELELYRLELAIANKFIDSRDMTEAFSKFRIIYLTLPKLL